MNILYGVQATGNGHINRSREIIKELKSRGHSILTIFSGRDSNQFWDIKEFSPYLIFRGLTFKTKNGHIKHFKTLINLRMIQFFNDIDKVYKKLDGYDLVISDFEPISLRAAERKRIFSINLSHQASFYYDDIPIKGKEFIGLWITKNFARCDLNIGVHWNQFNRRNIIIPPIVPGHLKDRMTKNKYLVYLPFENTSSLISIFSKLSPYNFYVYTHNNFNNLSNVFYRSFSREGFLNDLEECEGIISNAGFELISEALHLGKKILVKPVINQMEQESNAKCVELLHIGSAVKKLNQKSIEEFLRDGISKKIIYPQSRKIFVDWLEEGTFDVEKLIKMVWR